MIKLKSAIVIILSSILISSVILLTILGLSLYIGWMEKESAKYHRDEIARLNARLYSPLISIYDLQAKCENKGIYKGKYLIEGIVKNNGYRTVGSLKVSIDFLNASDDVIHVENLLPLKASIPARASTIAALSLFTSGKESPLLPGAFQRFKHVLSGQKDKDIISPIKYKRYATNPSEWSGKFNYKITGIKF